MTMKPGLRASDHGTPPYAALTLLQRFAVDLACTQGALDVELLPGLTVRQYLEGPRGEEALADWTAARPGTMPPWWRLLHCDEHESKPSRRRMRLV